jgi:hypothetical protein
MSETAINEKFTIPDPVQISFHQFYKEHFDEITKSPPVNRNFSVREEQVQLENGKKIIHLILETKDGKQKSLGDFLPPDIRFSRSNVFNYSPEHKAVNYISERLQYKGSILTVLHEMCHARQGVKPFSLFIGSNMKENQKLSIFFSSIVKKAYLDGRKGIAEAVGKMDDPAIHATVLATLPRDIANTTYQQRAAAERNAWAEALKLGRQLEREGYNVLGEFNNFAQLQTYITFLLASYEFRRAMDDKILTGDAEKTHNRYVFIRHPQAS